jgi:hypothetical protein
VLLDLLHVIRDELVALLTGVRVRHLSLLENVSIKFVQFKMSEAL